MELVIGIIVIGVLGYVAFFRKKEEILEVTPHKGETPTLVVVEETPAPASVTSVETLPVEVPVVTEVVADAPAKKPRKPRAPKVVAPPVKAPAKKVPAKAPAIAVVKKPRVKKS
jgi:hypothetical protein